MKPHETKKSIKQERKRRENDKKNQIKKGEKTIKR
jgi:hypothetical protein